MLLPIGFSIPECKIVKEIPKKEVFLSDYRPGAGYCFNSEEEYYNTYKNAIFGYTCCKAGWDCMRHYEILANGCIPWFAELKRCPPNTMTFFPKTLVFKSMAKVKSLDSPNRDTTIQELLDYTRQHLTTKAMAKYVLEESSHGSAKRVLFLSGHLWSDYLRDLTLHGFKELLGNACHDFPCIPFLYTDFLDEGLADLYGKGMSYSKLLDKSLMRDEILDSTLEADIRSHKYDVIIYGSLHRGLPLLELVTEVYEPKDVIFLCGEDLHDTCPADSLSQKGHYVFKREL